MKKFLSGLLLLVLIYAQTLAAPPEVKFSSFTARSFKGGVLVEWRSGFELDNLGYNIYRVKKGQRTRVNTEIIAGSALFAGQGNALYAGRSYVWRDTEGTSDSLYYLESIDLKGERKSYGPIATVPGVNDPKQQSSAVLAELGAGNSSGGSVQATQKEWPGTLAPQAQQSAQGPLEDQFAIAAQFGLKIRVRQDGLYRVTQPELVAAGIDPNVDADYLRLYADGYEQAMVVKSTDGHLAAGDYIEFYGFRMDIPTTDTRTYYLFRGSVPGKRISGTGSLKPDSTVVLNPPVAPSNNGKFTPPQVFFWGTPVFASPANSVSETLNPTDEQEKAKEAKDKGSIAQTPVQEEKQTREENQIQAQAQTQTQAEIVPQPQTESIPTPAQTSAQEEIAPTKAQPLKKRIKSRRKRINRRTARKHHNHASEDTAAGTPVFTNIVERKDHFVYFSSLLNGDAENFFGQVLVGAPITQTLNVHHLDTTSDTEVRLEIALQGVSLREHTIRLLEF